MEKVVDKKIEKSYEAGSGSLHIPFLGELFPKLFGGNPIESNKYFVYTESIRYEVSEDNYKYIIVGGEFDQYLSLNR